MIFSPSGYGPAKFPNINFTCNGHIIEKVDSYSYLGIIFKPSGSVSMAVQELVTKANRAYFSMSNIFYENKKMKVDRAL